VVVKTVFLSYAFPPLRYPRSIQVAHLARHTALPQLRVVAADEEDAEDGTLLGTLQASLDVTRLPWGRRARLARRLRARTLEDRLLVPDRFRPWTREAAREIVRRRFLGAGDLLVSFGQPMSDHIAGLRIARRTGARWIAHFSDPWADSPFRGGTVAPSINSRLERQVVAAADGILFTCDEALELVMGKYELTLQEKAAVVPHAFDPELYPEPDPTGDEVVVRYVGNFYGHRGPGSLLDALELLHERQPDVLAGVRFELVGSFEADPTASLAARRLPPGLVRLRPSVEYRESLALMRSADLLLILDAPADRSVFLPSKLIEYLGAGPPVFAITPPGAAARVVAETGGVHADPRDASAVADALARTLRAARARDGSRRPDGRAVAAYSVASVVPRFDDFAMRVALS
jgi:glycosyltransferase involved in cell wall biosynthesis